MSTSNTTASTATAAKGKTTNSSGAPKAARTTTRRGNALGADVIAQLEEHATTLQATLGFKPTAAQVVSMLLLKAKATPAQG